MNRHLLFLLELTWYNNKTNYAGSDGERNENLELG
jgi:hypothetical protein